MAILNTMQQPANPCRTTTFRQSFVVPLTRLLRLHSKSHQICSTVCSAERRPRRCKTDPHATDRRSIIRIAVLSAFSPFVGRSELAAAAPALPSVSFVTTPSGLKVEDIREGTGAAPQPGNRVAVHWSGYTIGYQGKRIENTSARDDPFEFVLGRQEAIPAFEEAVAGMRVGGVRRVEIPGDKPELSWSRNRSLRYQQGPIPHDFDGERSLSFVLDNDTLQPFNRTLLVDIKLLSVR